MRRVPILCVVALLFVPNGAWAQGEPLGPEFRVNGEASQYESSPAVASDSSGNLVVVWQSGGIGPYYGIIGQRYSSTGAPLGVSFGVGPNQLHTDAVSPSVASDSSGNFVVAWRNSGYLGGPSAIFARRYASTGTPLGPEFRVNTFPIVYKPPAVASDASGNFVIVWSGPGGFSTSIFGQRYANSGMPLGREFQVNTSVTTDEASPAAASDASGNFVVVWESYSQDGSDWGVFGQRYASTGAPLGPEFRVNTYTTSSQGGPAVAADVSGNFVVIWSGQGLGDAAGVFGQRYASTGAPLGPEFRANTHTTDFQGDPAVAMDSSGGFVVVWDSLNQDGSKLGVFGQRYASTGPPLGPEFRANTYTTNSQSYPVVAADGGGASGKFVVAWQSYKQAPGFWDDVFGQRYSQIVPVQLMHFRVE